MDCAQFKDIVHDLERAGTEGFALRVGALEHVETCTHCGALLDDVLTLNFSLDGMALEDGGWKAPAGMEATLRAEFRRHFGELARPQRRYRGAVLAVAASILMALAIRVHYRSVTRPAAPSGHTAVVAPASSGAAVAPEAESAGGESGEYATATGFVPLPFAEDDPRTLDGGTVVRVTLSRTALASFGVAVADAGGRERIPADIALSEDGVPQAIRLVADTDLHPSVE